MRKILSNYRFSIILLLGVVLGAIAGFAMGPKAESLRPIADVFLNLVFCLIVPIVFVSIASSIANMENVGKLRKILLIFLVVVIASGVITSILALATTSIFSPTNGETITIGNNNEEIESSLNIVNMLTVSDFSMLLSKDNMLPLIIFSIMFGIGVSLLGNKATQVKVLLNNVTEVLMKMVEMVMKLAPLGIACYFASMIGQMGGQVVSSIARISLIYVVFCILFFVLTSTLYTYWGGGFEGVKAYWRNITLPMTTAMGTCSSTACIPVNLLASEKMGIPKYICDIVIPLGGNTHKNGVVSVQIMKIAFLFAVFERSFGMKEMLVAIFVAVISGIIVGTIPSGGFIGEMFICTALGFPTEAIPIIVIMGTLTDPFCTMVNVTSDPAISMVITRLVEGKNWLKEKLAKKVTLTNPGEEQIPYEY
ncbi:dicarboxylate/amino acid:cation symporter [Bacillus sp. SD088]|uniref:dicarboxylate/amino acid:cation symporter n=1 Tax=Bacillus sp. SD088 TaxID=2782012 RepID=UPI001A961451|nr:dicarboxylate/amino acid:cation symporter [Bacillus sp. SD088]MBO0993182.1 dicarboxylate/amino acid:cation symporter [Bacillus sp. SD088]